MTLGLSPEQRDLGDAFVQFAGRHAPISATRDQHDALMQGRLPDWWDALVANGFHAVHLPERLGGQGGRLIDAACLLESAGKTLLAGPLLPTHGDHRPGEGDRAEDDERGRPVECATDHVPILPCATVGSLPIMSEYDDALSVERTNAGEWTARLGDGWSIGGAVNGGLLMALTAATLGRDVVDGSPDHVAPLAYSAHFLSASAEGPATLRTEVVRRGRTMTTGQVSLLQDVDGQPVERIRALVSYGPLGGRAEPSLRSTPAPAIPPVEECLPSSMGPTSFVDTVPLIARTDLLFDPATAGWALGQPSQEGRMQGWIRFADGRPVDATSLLFFLDALPPVSFDLGIMGWAPTLEFSGHVRAEPAPGWLQVELRTSNVSGGFLEEDATIWDSTGLLVAQSRQLAGVRIPDPA